MLNGEYRHTMDEKGRISIPSKFRKELGGKFVMTKSIGEKCLYIFALPEWKKIDQKFSELPLSDKNARRAIRYFVGGAAEGELDNQGRVKIPEYLRKFAELNRDVVLVGMSTRVEMWNGQLWDKYNEEYEDIEQDMERIGL